MIEDKGVTAILHRERERLDPQLLKNEAILKEVFTNCDDVSYRLIQIGHADQQGMLVFISNLVKKDLIDATILRELLGGIQGTDQYTVDQLKNQLVSASDVQVVTTIAEVTTDILSGRAILLLDYDQHALSIDVLGWEHRGVEKSENEVSIRGSQQAFTENLMNNVALVRRFIRDTRLKVENNTIGEVTKTPYVMLYMKGIVDESILQQVKMKLKTSKLDGVFDSGLLIEKLRNTVMTPFPLINRTERPDRVAALLLEGRVIILVDNSPMALSVPALMVEFLQVPEDYYENFWIQSGIRLLRYLALVVSLTAPSLYVAIVGYHHELIPASMMPSLMSQREGIPLPTVLEVFIMEFVFEILREAGLRLPRPIGQAVSIVGALVIGQAAVQAKLVMATTVIVVAMTGISSFMISGVGIATATRFLRMPLLFITGLLGLFGFTIGIFMILIHLFSLRSFGVIYTGALAPRTWRDLKDTLFRLPYQHRAQVPWQDQNGE